MGSVTAQAKELWGRTAPERVIRPKDDMFLDHWLPTAERFIDANWKQGKEIKPSSILVLRYCVLMTGSDEAETEAQRLFRHWRRTSRQRYRDGFYANPLGEPVPRSNRNEVSGDK